MRRDRGGSGQTDPVISIIAPGTRVQGDVEAEGTVRIEGEVLGDVRAGKAVVVGKEGVVEGDVATQDAVLSGTVRGMVVAASRLELQSTCRVEGEVRALRMQLEEGAILNGQVTMGEDAPVSISSEPEASAEEGVQEAPRESRDDGSEGAPREEEAVPG